MILTLWQFLKKIIKSQLFKNNLFTFFWNSVAYSSSKNIKVKGSLKKVEKVFHCDLLYLLWKLTLHKFVALLLRINAMNCYPRLVKCFLLQRCSNLMNCSLLDSLGDGIEVLGEGAYGSVHHCHLLLGPLEYKSLKKKFLK